MDTLKYLVWIGAGLLALVAITVTIVVVFHRRVVESRYEWLVLLSHTEWKPTLQIWNEMAKVKGVNISFGSMFSDLAILEEEKLVEFRIALRKVKSIRFPTTREYRLTPAGTRKKLEVGSAQKEKEDLQLQPT